MLTVCSVWGFWALIEHNLWDWSWGGAPWVDAAHSETCSSGSSQHQATGTRKGAKAMAPSFTVHCVAIICHRQSVHWMQYWHRYPTHHSRVPSMNPFMLSEVQSIKEIIPDLCLTGAIPPVWMEPYTSLRLSLQCPSTHPCPPCRLGLCPLLIGPYPFSWAQFLSFDTYRLCNA